jgi:hypothetical protein
MVKVFFDVITGDEMVSDSYDSEVIFNETCLEVQGCLRTKKGEHFELGGDDDADDTEGATVIDIVDSFNLKETSYDKKTFNAYIKGNEKT